VGINTHLPPNDCSMEPFQSGGSSARHGQPFPGENMAFGCEHNGRTPGVQGFIAEL
jgi:hypothetical protein